MEKTNIPLSHVPPDFQFDPDALWNNLIDLFKESYQKRDISGLQKSLNQIEYYSSTLKNYFSTSNNQKESRDLKLKKLYSMIISPFFDFITTVPFIDFSLQSRAAKLFSNICVRYQTRPELSDVHLSLEKALSLHKELFVQPRRLMRKNLPKAESANFLLFLSCVHHFLDDSDGDKLLEKYLDKIGCFETVSLISTLTLLRFYPTTEKCLEKIIKHLIPILENPISHQTTCAIFHYFDKTYSSANYNHFFDWKPYLRPIINSISTSINPSVSILDDEYNLFDDQQIDFPIGIIGGFDRESIPLYSSSFISSLLVEYEEEKDDTATVCSSLLTILNDFVNAFIPMITPHSNKAEGAVTFVSNLIKKFVSIKKRVKSMNKKQKVTDQTSQQFVKIVLPFVEVSLFNGPAPIQNEILNNVAKLADLSFDLTINGLVPFCMQNLVDPEMSTTSKMCFKVIKNLIPYLLNEEHIEDNLTKVPQIIEACLERCKNSLLENYYLGMTTLSDIAQFIMIPSDKEMNSKLSMKQRMAATAMINSLKVVIDCHFNHNKSLTSESSTQKGVSLNKNNEQQGANEAKTFIDKHFDCYFAAFDDSYIESIVLPYLIKHLKSASHASVLDSFTYQFTQYLANVKPDLITKVLSPQLEELFNKATVIKKTFWANILASTMVSCQTFSDNMSHYIEMIINLLSIKEEEKKEDDENDESNTNLECAHVLIQKLLTTIPKPNIVEWSNTEEGEFKWGKLYNESEVNPKWYQIDQKTINSAAETIFNSIKPHLIKFPSYSLKKQKIMSKILSSFFGLFEQRGKIGQIEFNDLHDNETFSSIEKAIFQFINEMLPSLQSYQSKEEILVLLSVGLVNHRSEFNKMNSICQNISRKKKKCQKPSRYYCLLSYLYEVSSSLYNYSYEVTSNVDLVLDNVLSSMDSEFDSISHQAFFILNHFAFKSKRINEDFVLKELSILESQDHNEYQLKSSILFFMKSNLSFIMNNVELLVRFFKALVTLKYEKGWKISEYLNSLFDSIELYRQTIHIDECKCWRDLNNEILSLPRKIDARYFYTIIRFIVFQDPPPSIEIVRFIVNSLKSSSDVNRLFALQSMSNILCRMKPIAPRKQYNSVDDFKSENKELLPFIDKMTTGFHCKPHHYVFYTGPSVFDPNDSKFAEIRKFLTEEVFVNEKIFTSLFESFALLHPKEDSPTFNTHIYGLWKGIGQIIKTPIVKYTKSLILRLLDARYISLTSPVLLTAICELIAGISRATKHWNQEEKKIAIDELLIPSCTPLIHTKGNDQSTMSVQVMASTIVGDWDFRRVQWLYELVKNQLSEIQCNKDQMNEVVLRSVMNFANIIYMQANEFFNEEFIHIMKEIIIPLFADMKKFKLDDLSYFANFLVCRLSLTRQYHPNDEKCQENYYGSPSFKSSKEMAALTFIDVFDKHKENMPELVALFLSEIFSGKMHDFSFFLPFVVERFKDICNIDSKLINITSGKFLHYGKNIMCKLGILQWENYGESIFEVLFENVIKKQIMDIKESLPWNSRLNLVGFLHALTFSHFFLFTKKEFMLLIDEVLPSFLSDSNQEVRKAALSLLKMLVCIAYSDDHELCSEKVKELFELANKDKNKINKNLFVAVSFASALLANVSVWFKDCPLWLPDIFNELERNYSQGNCKEEIKSTTTEFFTRHEGSDIPEIEDYKYSFTDRYFT